VCVRACVCASDISIVVVVVGRSVGCACVHMRACVCVYVVFFYNTNILPVGGPACQKKEVYGGQVGKAILFFVLCV
jgi:hypothetical protein